jgi:uncharacterized protein with HEPN domain
LPPTPEEDHGPAQRFKRFDKGAAKLDEALASRISEYHRIIAFRNILIHGYDQVDHQIVWDILESKLPALRGGVSSLLAQG